LSQDAQDDAAYAWFQEDIRRYYVTPDILPYAFRHFFLQVRLPLAYDATIF